MVVDFIGRLLLSATCSSHQSGCLRRRAEGVLSRVLCSRFPRSDVPHRLGRLSHASPGSKTEPSIARGTKGRWSLPFVTFGVATVAVGRYPWRAVDSRLD